MSGMALRASGSVRLVRLLVSVAAFVLLVGGCGGNDGESIQGVERQAQETPQGESEATDESAATITKAAFHRCVQSTDLKLAKEAGPVPGKPETSRANFELTGTEYAGFVVWPSGAIADVWIAPDEDTAESAEKEYEGVYKQFGKGDQGETLVQRKANAVVALDDEEPPSPDEAKTLDGCLAPTGS